MGMFDDLKCNYPLPNPKHQDLDFQTKSLECMMTQYLITEDGRLVWIDRYFPDHDDTDRKKLKTREIDRNYHGDIVFYAGRGCEYIARFTEGKVVWIREEERMNHE